MVSLGSFCRFTGCETAKVKRIHEKSLAAWGMDKLMVTIYAERRFPHTTVGISSIASDDGPFLRRRLPWPESETQKAHRQITSPSMIQIGVGDDVESRFQLGK